MKKIQQLIGVSALVRELEQELVYAARSDAKVLITGESGVGKEVVAHLIHQRSHRSGGPLVTINCAGVPDTLLESELFGHVRGSFTDAYRDKRGRLELASGGTVLMDEVGEMSLRMQALLLRFLESGEIQRVGSDRRQTTVDVRVVAATNRDLLGRIASKEFREDLYYRLNVIHLRIPPLRERPEDIPLLFAHFLRFYSEAHGVDQPELSAETQALVLAYQWPGNTREVRNVVERLVVRCHARPITPADLPLEIAIRRPPVDLAPPSAPVRPVALALFDRMVQSGDSFWSAVYEPFMSRDLTRDDLRTIVRQGMEVTRGSYKSLVQLFNMPADDYKRFLNFLRKYECHMPFQRFRCAPARIPEGTEPQRVSPSALERVKAAH